MYRGIPLSKWTCTILLTAVAAVASADERPAQICSESTLLAVAQQLDQPGWQVPGWGTQGPVVAAACKAWPDDPNLQVFAVAYTRADAPQDEEHRDLALIVGQLETATGTLRSRFDSAIGEDAMTQLDYQGLWLDTARYWLTPDVRAFGVVVHSSARGASCPDGGANDELTLYVAQGQQLRDVFRTYLNQWTTLEGTSCVSGSRFISERSRITLDVAKQRRQGFADLLLTAIVQRDENGDAIGAPRRVKRTVHYDGQRYPFEAFSDFWQSTPVASP